MQTKDVQTYYYCNIINILYLKNEHLLTSPLYGSTWNNESKRPD